jgi:serine/threonine protein kinase
MSPEVLSGEIVTPKADVYSFAIVLWELMTGNSPFEHHEDYGEFLKAVIDQVERPPIPPEMDPKIAQLIKDCWQPDPVKRPAFEDILPRIYTISIETAIINDPLGVSLWSDNWFGQNHCTWNKFLQPFYKKMGEPLGRDREIQTSYKILLFLLTKDSSTDGALIVDVEAFGRFLAWFGPLTGKGSPSFLERMLAICSEKWFHGTIERTQAEALLAQYKRKGSFLVRLSLTDPHACPFTISRLTMGKAVEHQRIFRSKDGVSLYTNIKNPKDKTNTKYEEKTLDALIKKISKPLDLKEVCLGSQFQQKFFADAGEVGDYNEPVDDDED